MDTLCKSAGEFLVKQLMSWFRETKRDLPWRKTYDPYHVWISEIMLQQTQMERGVRYFNRWIERFPTVEDVACAQEDDILMHWEGLGYYARARNLHKAAKEIASTYSAVVPSDYQTLLTLPGIGPYTAAAVASIAGNEDVVVIDANVNRIFARILDITEPVKHTESQKHIFSEVNSLLPTGKARIFNQALMDFGGLVCTPKNPQCELCEIQKICKAFSSGVVAERPVLKVPPKTILIHRLVAVIINDGKIYMQKRPSSSVWGGLWEFPGGEQVVDAVMNSKIDLAKEVSKDTGIEIIVGPYLVQVQHQYTHHKISLDAYTCELIDRDCITPDLANATAYRWMTPREMDGCPCPSGVRKIIEHLKEISPDIFS